MTTTVTVQPFGHNVEVKVTENGVDTLHVPDPHAMTSYSVYDSKSVTVRETGGRAEKGDESGAVQTFGEAAVGLTFNPSGDIHVHHCKRLHALLIDQMHNLREGTKDPEQKRLASVAITELQTAQMWAVKALTWR